MNFPITNPITIGYDMFDVKSVVVSEASVYRSRHARFAANAELFCFYYFFEIIFSILSAFLIHRYFIAFLIALVIFEPNSCEQ